MLSPNIISVLVWMSIGYCVKVASGHQNIFLLAIDKKQFSAYKSYQDIGIVSDLVTSDYLVRLYRRPKRMV